MVMMMLDLKPIRQRLVSIHTAEWLENAPDDIADLLNEVEMLREQVEHLRLKLHERLKLVFNHYSAQGRSPNHQHAANIDLWEGHGIPLTEVTNAQP